MKRMLTILCDRRHLMLTVGLVIVVSALLSALMADWLAPFPSQSQNLAYQLKGPDAQHLFGNDHQGKDLLTIIIYGSRLSLGVGLCAVLISLLLGTIIGSISGYYGGWVDTVLMRLVDVFLAFPGILLAIAIAAVRGPGIKNLIIALSVVGWVPFARLVRGQMLSLKERDFVLAARSLGVGGFRLVTRHMLPLCLSPLLVQATFALAAAILTEASLSFLGLGAPHDVASWGQTLSHGSRYLLEAPHLSTFPGIAIMVTVLGLNFIGDGLRDILDVQTESV